MTWSRVAGVTRGLRIRSDQGARAILLEAARAPAPPHDEAGRRIDAGGVARELVENETRIRRSLLNASGIVAIRPRRWRGAVLHLEPVRLAERITVRANGAPALAVAG